MVSFGTIAINRTSPISCLILFKMIVATAETKSFWIQFEGSWKTALNYFLNSHHILLLNLLNLQSFLYLKKLILSKTLNPNSCCPRKQTILIRFFNIFLFFSISLLCCWWVISNYWSRVCSIPMLPKTFSFRTACK